jgi:hypothetical protein
MKITRRGKPLPILGFCGDDCDVCQRYIATKSGDKEELRKVAVLWHKIGYRDRIVPPEELICHGCSSWYDRVERPECAFRAVQKCGLEKGVENCGKCENYACEKVMRVFDQVELSSRSIKGKCSKEEFEHLRKAFFSKRENLNRVNKEWRSHARNAPR